MRPISPWERYVYEQSLKSARDSYAVYKTVEEESLERGLEQGLVVVVKKSVRQLPLRC